MTDSTPTPKISKTRLFKMSGLAILFLILGILWFLYWLLVSRFELFTDDAYVNGNMVQLMSQIPGTVTEIYADDTQLVQRGQILIKLDSADAKIALQQAYANLAETVRQVRQIFEEAKRAQANVNLRKLDLLKAKLDMTRRKGLVGPSAVSKEEFEHYQTEYEAAQARYNEAIHALSSAEAIVQNSHLYTHPRVEAAKSNFRNAYINAQRTTVVAPVTGYIAKRNVQVGQRIMINTPMMAIVPMQQLWVDANYKESQLKNIRIGQAVTLESDAYPDAKYHGRIVGLSAGTGAAFSLLPPQNASGNWIKIVQRLPVRIALDPKEIKEHPLQLGLSMLVTTNTRDMSGHRLAQISPFKLLYATDVYEQQLKDADQWITKIMRSASEDMYAPRFTSNE